MVKSALLIVAFAFGVFVYAQEAPSDITPAVISDIILSQVPPNSIKIEWLTNEPALYTFEYGTSSSYGSTVSMPEALSIGGTATPTNLLPETTYYYCIHATDASDNVSNTCDSFTTLPTPDTTASIISGVANELLLSTSTKIVWVTDEPSYSKVRYGKTEGFGAETMSNTTAKLLHETMLTGLTPNTKYYFCIDAKDTVGNESDSCGHTFTTAVAVYAQDIAPPAVSSLVVTNITTSSAKMTWTTNESAKTQVQYGLTIDYGTTSRLSRNFERNHSVNLYRLKPFTLYHYRVKSTDRAGNVSTSADETFTTLAWPQSNLPGAVSPAPAPSSVDGASESGAVREEYIREYRNRSNDLQQKINALSNVADASVLMPVLFGVVVKNLYPSFGDPRSGGRTHEGNDIMAIKGTPVISPTPAVVIRVAVGPSEGNAIYTSNPGGEVFVYMHLDRHAEGITRGTVLSRGSLVGYVGNTGNAAGGPAHLHFEIHNSSGVSMDPFPRLTGEFSLQEKISSLFQILTQTSDSAALAQFLVLNFRSTFNSAVASGITLPPVIGSYLASMPATATPSTTRTLRVGSSGDDVRLLQSALGGLVIDGKFGPKTKAALVLFQSTHGLVTDGIFGPKSRAVLAGSSSTGVIQPAGCTASTIYSPTTGIKCL